MVAGGEVGEAEGVGVGEVCLKGEHGLGGHVLRKGSSCDWRTS